MSTALQTAKPLNPIEASLECLLAIVFPRSTSKNFPFALKLAGRVSHFEEGILEGKTYYLAGISREKTDVLLAKALLEYVSGWKGTRVFISGSVYQSAYTVMQVLDCYSQAMQCSDPRAHCQVVIEHPEITAMKSMVGPSLLSFSNNKAASDAYDKLDAAPKILFPCRYISAYNDVIQEGHPSPIEDQIQAAAVRHGCQWCPLFDPSEIRLIDAKQ